VEGSIALDASDGQHAFDILSDITMMPRLYPSTTGIRVLSQERSTRSDGGTLLVTTCEQVGAAGRSRAPLLAGWLAGSRHDKEGEGGGRGKGLQRGGQACQAQQRLALASC
jgi:hypothetical protein